MPIDAGDTAFIIFSTALVMLMTPGLSLFYGGMVRQKNVLSIIAQSFVAIALISIQWVLFGYSLAFGPDHAHLIGGLDWLGFAGVGMGPNPNYAPTIPHAAFAMFQLMFAIITPALITGSFAERMRFPAFLLFTLLWTTLVYDPLAHWVWGTGGWLRNLGALDFAGGTVVHISSGISGLVAALVLGRRQNYGSAAIVPHNIPMTVLGAGLLWFGWFGFNAGSALAANGLAVHALVTTDTSAAAATFGWMMVEWLRHRRPTVLGAASGAVAGLVAITPAAGFVTPLAAVVIGLVGGIICCLAVSVLKAKLGYDDSLDAFGCHGIGGTWGALATGLFATQAVNPAGANGLLYGNPGLLGTQAVAALVAIGFAAVGSLVLLKAVQALVGVRVSPEDEEAGLDLTQHGESAYPQPEYFGSPGAATASFGTTSQKAQTGRQETLYLGET
ncbi:MAG: ammonium transporter [Clostridia bacterium]|nr:MAG: ammonium transporter [Clostridia bacterium]